MPNKFETYIETINDVKTLNEIKRICDSRIANLDEDRKANMLSNRNFGYIKESMENLSSVLYRDNFKNYLKDYVNCIKENKDLKKVHTFYECIRKADKHTDINAYLTEAISLLDGVDRNNYNQSMKALAKIFCESYKACGNEQLLPDYNKKLDEAVEFVVFNKKSPKNLAEYNYCLNVIKEHIENKETDFVPPIKNNIDEVADNLVRGFNEKYSDNSNEMRIVKEVVNAKDKSKVFEKYQNQCIQKLQEGKKSFEKTGDAESAEKLTMILEKVSSRKYNPNTLNTDVTNFIELVNCVE